MNKYRLVGSLVVLFAASVLTLNVARSGEDPVLREPAVREPLPREPVAREPVGEPNSRGGISYRAKELIGAAVQLDGGASAGTIDDIVFDESGMVDFLLVINAKRQLVAVPWAASRFDARQRVIFLQIAPERFREIPTFTVNNFPVFTAVNFRTRIFGFFGMKPGDHRHGDRQGRIDVRTNRIDYGGKRIDPNDRRPGTRDDRRPGDPDDRRTVPDRRPDGRQPAPAPKPRTDVKDPRPAPPDRRIDDRDPPKAPPAAPKEKLPPPKSNP